MADREALECLNYCVVRKAKGLEIGPWEWRKKIEGETEKERKAA